MKLLLGLVLAFSSIFLILLVLVQRGRGGGLSGALGGAGGQSAFGAKAGDIFTYITIWTVTIWILLCMSALWWVGCQKGDALQGQGGSAPASSQGMGGLPTLPDDIGGDLPLVGDEPSAGSETGQPAGESGGGASTDVPEADASAESTTSSDAESPTQ